MKPMIHAKLSASKWGGVWQDYLEIHEWFDQTKAHMPDMRHRAILHNSFGIYLATDFFGDVFQNSEGRDICTRDIGEEHIIQDLGFIPTLEDYFDGRYDEDDGMPMHPWIGGLPKSVRKIDLGLVD